MALGRYLVLVHLDPSGSRVIPPYLDPKEWPKVLKHSQKAIILHTLGVQATNNEASGPT